MERTALLWHRASGRTGFEPTGLSGRQGRGCGAAGNGEWRAGDCLHAQQYGISYQRCCASMPVTMHARLGCRGVHARSEDRQARTCCAWDRAARTCHTRGLYSHPSSVWCQVCLLACPSWRHGQTPSTHATPPAAPIPNDADTCRDTKEPRATTGTPGAHHEPPSQGCGSRFMSNCHAWQLLAGASFLCRRTPFWTRALVPQALGAQGSRTERCLQRSSFLNGCHRLVHLTSRTHL